MKIEFPEAGKIINTHGFRGRLKAEAWCDSPGVLAGLKTVYLKKDGGLVSKAVKYGSVLGGFVLLDLDGIDSEEKAKALKGSVLYARRGDVVRGGALLLAEMAGLPVTDEAGKRLGTIIEVTEGVASRLWRVKTEAGEVLMPDVPAFVVSVSFDGAVVRTIPGLLDNEGEEIRDDTEETR